MSAKPFPSHFFSPPGSPGPASPLILSFSIGFETAPRAEASSPFLSTQYSRFYNQMSELSAPPAAACDLCSEVSDSSLSPCSCGNHACTDCTASPFPCCGTEVCVLCAQAKDVLATCTMGCGDVACGPCTASRPTCVDCGDQGCCSNAVVRHVRVWPCWGGGDGRAGL